MPSTAPTAAPGSEGMDEIIKALRDDRAERSVAATGPATGATTKASLPTGRGPTVIDRLVRLTPEPKKPWMLARFEADNTLHQPPLRLLPCRMLEIAEQTASRSRVLRVTGRIYVYKGRRYLLLLKVLSERDLQRF